MKTYALDTGFFVLFFVGDRDAGRVYEEIRSGRSRGFTLETNLAELYYKTCQRLGAEVAGLRDSVAQSSIRNSAIEVRGIDERVSRRGRGDKVQGKGRVAGGCPARGGIDPWCCGCDH